jgi:hypothetical protein
MIVLFVKWEARRMTNVELQMVTVCSGIPSHVLFFLCCLNIKSDTLCFLLHCIVIISKGIMQSV